MLTVRQDQLRALREARLRQFEHELVRDLRRRFPDKYESMGKAKSHEFMRLAIDRSARHRMKSERDVCRYAILMAMLGGYFDEDPQLPWASAILQEAAANDPSAGCDLLFQTTIDYLDRVAGPEAAHLDRALHRVRDTPREQLFVDQREEAPLLVALHRIYPEKFEEVGEENLRNLMRQGRAGAASYQLASAGGISFFIGLMFMLGSGFDRDPQYPMAGSVLSDRSIDGEPARLDRLYAEAMSALDKRLA